MAQYNLVKNSIFISNTTSGIGNKQLTAAQLYTLIDDDITTDDILLNINDIVCLDVDLGRRIKIDTIALYTDDLTQGNNVKIYYKNYIGDNYLPCDQSVSTVAYIGTVPSPSAPQYIRCTISGASFNLREFFIFNDDTVVGFGDDGTETYKWLENTPIGSDSEPYIVDIYNNSPNALATAYVCVDYTGNKDDVFIKISNTVDGAYKNLEDGTLLGFKAADWNVGFYTSNVQLDVNNNAIVLTNKGSITKTYKEYLGTLPLTFCNYQGVPFGLQDNCWCYATDRNLIYAVFYSGTSNSNGTFILYSYTLSTNIWTFISNLVLPTASLTSSQFSMTYLNNYIYFTYGANSFGRYNLNGAAGNYERLANVNYGGNHYHKLCASSNDVFLFCKYWGGSGWYWLTNHKYIIATNTWTEVSKPYNNNGRGNDRGNICYDPIRNVIYMMYTDVDFKVSRYDITNNIWINEFFNIGNILQTTINNVSMCYYDNRLFFAGYSLGNKLYTLNVVTNIVNSYNMPNTFKNQNYVYILATPPQYTNNDFSLYFLGINSAGTYDFFGYNTNFNINTDATILSTAIGTYTTNIFYLENNYTSGYLLVRSTSTYGLTSVSKDPSLQDGTIEVRSSDISPNSIEDIFWGYNDYSTNSARILKYSVVSNILTTSWKDASLLETYFSAMDVARYSGNLLISSMQYSGGNWYFTHTVLNRTCVTLQDYYYTANGGWESYSIFWDNNNGYWVYHANKTMRHHYLYTNWSWKSETIINNMGGMAANLNGVDLWYTDRDSQAVIRLDSNCSVKVNVQMGNVYGICSTEDGGCWVVDNADSLYTYTIKRLDFYGNIVKVIPTDKAFYYIIHDHSDGFYGRPDSALGEIYHFNANGEIDMKVTGLPSFDSFRAGRNGLVAHSSAMDKIVYISLSEKRVIWEKTRSSITTAVSWPETFTPCIFSWDLATELRLYSTWGLKLLPDSTDVYWNNTLPWKEVPKDGYILPNNKYHQVRVTLRNFDAVSTPSLDSIIVAPVIVIEDIPPLSSKPLYVKSSIPASNTDTQFNTRLRVWWSMGE